MSEPETPAAAPAPSAGGSGGIGKSEGKTGVPPRRIPLNTSRPKPISPIVLIGFVVVGAGLVGALLFFSHRVVGDTADKIVNRGPQLQGEFVDRHNSYGIRPPVGWKIRDPHDQKNIYITGPNDPVFPPMIVVNLDIKAGAIASYMQEHKGRIQFENKSAEFISEEPDSIDGAVATRRFVYDLDHVTDKGETVRIRTLQYIMEDKPRFYRVTCHARVEHFERLLPYFEASARSFRRTRIPKNVPSPLAD